MPPRPGYDSAKVTSGETLEHLEEIKAGQQTIAIIVRNEFGRDGTQFFTPAEFPMQLGYMKHMKGYRIGEHVHRPLARQVERTQETLFVKRGRVRVDFYTDDKAYISSRELKGGDVILLASGGHGFEFLEETEMIEVKQGPYCGDQDKVRFVEKKE